MATNLVGTQLNIPSDDEDERGSKTVPIWDQVVKDEQGRRRFHGAFTGGFSAGYFNTVGSAEGWTPTQFRSSRDKPAQYRPQTVEDFMDEEDKKLLGHELATRQQFDTLDQESQKLAQKGLRRDTSKSFAGARLQDFFVVPASHSVGKQILKEMGWKEGQGVGPRLSMREKKRAEPKKTRIGFEDQLGAVFAPENAEVYRVTPKNDNYGLGFDPKRGQGDFAALGPQRLMDSTGMFAAGGSSSKGPLRMGDVLTGRTTKGPSLGMGALEDGDDYDVYGSEDISQFDRFSGPLLTEGPQEETHSDSEDDGLERPSRCADGRPPLSGFKLASIQWDKTEADIALALAGGHSGSIHVPESFVPVHQFPDLPQTNEQSVDKAVDHAVQKIQEQLKQRSSRFAPPSSAPPPDVNVWEREARPDIAQVRNEASVALDSRFVSTTTATSEEDMTGAAMAKDPKQGPEVVPSTIAPRRTTSEWVPNKLLCKRFNVPDPFLGRERPSEEAAPPSAGFAPKPSVERASHRSDERHRSRSRDSERSTGKYDERRHSHRSKHRDSERSEHHHRSKHHSGRHRSHSRDRDRRHSSHHRRR